MDNVGLHTVYMSIHYQLAIVSYTIFLYQRAKLSILSLGLDRSKGEARTLPVRRPSQTKFHSSHLSGLLRPFCGSGPLGTGH